MGMSNIKMGDLERQFVLTHPEMTNDELAKKFGVCTMTIKRIRSRAAGLGMTEKEKEALPPVPVIQERVEDKVNWLESENTRKALSESIGGKLKMTLDALTPEKASRSNFRDLAISAGILMDKLREINQDSTAGVGMLAAALIKAVSAQMRSISFRTEAPSQPEPPTIVAEAEVVDA